MSRLVIEDLFQTAPPHKNNETRNLAIFTAISCAWDTEPPPHITADAYRLLAIYMVGRLGGMRDGEQFVIDHQERRERRS